MRTLLTMIFCLALLAPARSQAIEINLDSLAAKAKDKAEVTLEGSLLAQVLQAAPANVKTANVSRVLVRHYEFEKAGQYSDSDLDSVRKQVSSGSGWSRIVNVKDNHESTEIYMLSKDGKAGGFLLITAEPKELTVVHVVGSVDMANLKAVVDSTIHYDLKSAGQ